MTLRLRAVVAAAAMTALACSSSPTPSVTATPVPASQAPSEVASASPTASPSPVATAAPTPGGTTVPAPADFVASVDNPFFPLRPGTVLRYEGSKDGEKAVETLEVSADTAVVAGVTCVVIHDTLTLAGELAEKTTDWYAQDRFGNVWYFGEDTAEYEGGVVTSTEGTWRAGVDGAAAGIFMPADPKVGDSFAQEHYAGHAEDHFVVLLVGVSTKVPYGSITGALLTLEWTPLEPDVLSEKIYARGIGTVREADVVGGAERLELVKATIP